MSYGFRIEFPPDALPFRQRIVDLLEDIGLPVDGKHWHTVTTECIEGVFSRSEVKRLGILGTHSAVRSAPTVIHFGRPRHPS